MRGPIITEGVKVNALRADDALDSLVARGLLDERHNAAYGTGYTVALAGRNYLLKKGLV